MYSTNVAPANLTVLCCTVRVQTDACMYLLVQNGWNMLTQLFSPLTITFFLHLSDITTQLGRYYKSYYTTHPATTTITDG